MYFERFFDPGLAQASYLIGCQEAGEAIVVDPLRDVDKYLSAAGREGMRIVYVTETHVHADFVSGARQLAGVTGARLALSDQGGDEWNARFSHTPLRGGDEIALGQVLIRVLHTPGHTPEHLSFLVIDRAAGDDPLMMLTGDFLFVGDVGRPDLLESAVGIAGGAAEGARMLFSSTRSILDLPEYVQVWPGHGAGSACGKAMGALPSTTVGYEKRTNWALRDQTEGAFIESVLDGQPDVPTYFGRMKQINRGGAAFFDTDAVLRRLDEAELREQLGTGVRIVDCRGQEEFAEAHIPGAINIPGDSSFTSWAGWLLDPESRYVLVAPHARAEELRRSLGRVGIDHVLGYVDAPADWAASGERTGSVRGVTARELADLRAGGPDGYHLVDVRTAEEFDDGHIPGATHIHLGHLPRRIDELPNGSPILVYCRSGGRSSIAASLLLAAGVDSVTNLQGGFTAWQELGGAAVERRRAEVGEG